VRGGGGLGHGGWWRRGGWLLALLLLVAVGARAQKTRYSTSAKASELDYPLTVHVLGSRLAVETVLDANGAAATASVLHLSVAIDGDKMDLAAPAGALVHPGDYLGRVASNEERKSGWFSRTYELLFGDGTHVVFKVVGEGQ
jgi:hypothetical protein